jgi:hypothetical protein
VRRAFVLAAEDEAGQSKWMSMVLAAYSRTPPILSPRGASARPMSTIMSKKEKESIKDLRKITFTETLEPVNMKG